MCSSKKFSRCHLGSAKLVLYPAIHVGHVATNSSTRDALSQALPVWQSCICFLYEGSTIVVLSLAAAIHRCAANCIHKRGHELWMLTRRECLGSTSAPPLYIKLASPPARRLPVARHLEMLFWCFRGCALGWAPQPHARWSHVGTGCEWSAVGRRAEGPKSPEAENLTAASLNTLLGLAVSLSHWWHTSIWLVLRSRDPGNT